MMTRVPAWVRGRVPVTAPDPAHPDAEDTT